MTTMLYTLGTALIAAGKETLRMFDCIRKGMPLLVAALLASAALVGSSAVLKYAELNSQARVMVALVPLVFYIGLFIVAVGYSRRLDELKRRIELEALAFAVIGVLLSTIGYGMLIEADVGLPNLTWSKVWITTVVFYMAGRLVAWRRYR